MIGKKVLALLNIKKISSQKAYKYLHMHQSAFSRKVANDTFKVRELIKLAELSGTNLAFVDKETQKVIVFFDDEDLETNGK